MLLWYVLACATKDEPGDTGACDTENEECGPDVDGCGGEGSNMLPGSDCVTCHSPGEEGEGSFSIAGTVYVDIDGSDGLEDAVIRVTDANGDVFELDSHSSGSFYTEDDTVPPLQAEIEVDGEVVSMAADVETGACNSCHSCEGAAGGKLFGP